MACMTPKISIPNFLFGWFINFLLGLELQSSLVQQFELETVPFMQRGALLVGLGRDYRPLNVSKEVCYGAWSCLLKSCDMFLDNKDSVSYVAVNPLVTVSTCQLRFDLDRLTEDDDNAAFYRQASILIIISLALWGVQFILGVTETILNSKCCFRRAQEREILINNEEADDRRRSRRCACFAWIYIAVNLLIKVLLVVSTGLIIHITWNFSDVPDSAKYWESLAKSSFIVGIVVEGVSSVIHSFRRERKAVN